jgi:hypothetical protein
LLLGGAHRDDQLIISSGDLYPSDLDDSIPSVLCELSDYLNFNEDTPDIVAKEIAQSAARSTVETTVSGGGNSGGSNSELEDINECGTGAGCNYKVIVQWHTSELQGQDNPAGCGGPCGCVGGCSSCSGPLWSVCHTYGTAWGARQAAQYWKNSYPRPEYWRCGQTVVWSVAVANGTHSGPGAGDCEDISGGGTDPGGDTAAGEIANPIGLTGNEPE